MLDFSEPPKNEEVPQPKENVPSCVPEILHECLVNRFGDIEYKLTDELPEKGIRFFNFWNRECKEFENWNLDMVVLSYQRKAIVYRIRDNVSGDYLC